jgi:hypothetical protein
VPSAQCANSLHQFKNVHNPFDNSSLEGVDETPFDQPDLNIGPRHKHDEEDEEDFLGTALPTDHKASLAILFKTVISHIFMLLVRTLESRADLTFGSRMKQWP